MTPADTLGVQSQVFGSLWTLKHHRVLDLLHQQLQEVLPGCVAVPEAAGKRSLLVVFEPWRRFDEKEHVKHGDLKTGRFSLF